MQAEVERRILSAVSELGDALLFSPVGLPVGLHHVRMTDFLPVDRLVISLALLGAVLHQEASSAGH